jgi:hypothetical protein
MGLRACHEGPCSGHGWVAHGGAWGARCMGVHARRHAAAVGHEQCMRCMAHGSEHAARQALHASRPCIPALWSIRLRVAWHGMAASQEGGRALSAAISHACAWGRECSMHATLTSAPVA